MEYVACGSPITVEDPVKLTAVVQGRCQLPQGHPHFCMTLGTSGVTHNGWGEVCSYRPQENSLLCRHCHDAMEAHDDNWTCSVASINKYEQWARENPWRPDLNYHKHQGSGEAR